MNIIYFVWIGSFVKKRNERVRRPLDSFSRMSHALKLMCHGILHVITTMSRQVTPSSYLICICICICHIMSFFCHEIIMSCCIELLPCHVVLLSCWNPNMSWYVAREHCHVMSISHHVCIRICHPMLHVIIPIICYFPVIFCIRICYLMLRVIIPCLVIF